MKLKKFLTAFKAMRAFFIVYVFVIVSALAVRAMPLTQLDTKLVRKVALLIGTFDPLHRQHEQLIDAALNQAGVDAVLVIPQDFEVLGLKPYKSRASPLTTRLKMLQARYGTNPRVLYPDQLLMNQKPTVANVLLWLKMNLSKDTELYGIYGSDRLSSLWIKLVDRFWMPTTKNLVHNRRDFFSAIAPDSNFLGKPMDIIEVDETKFVNSSFIREAISSGRFTIEEILKWVHPRVLRFIVQNQIYSPDFRENSATCRDTFQAHSK